jgi:hypothetical protein
MSPRRLGIALALVAAAAGPAGAHEGGTNGYATITVDGDRARYILALWPEALPEALAADIRRAQAGDETSRGRLTDLVRDKVTLTAGGRRCAVAGGSARPVPPASTALTLVLDFVCGGDVTTLRIRDDLFDVLGADHHTLARIDLPGRSVQFAFDFDARETEVALDGGEVGGFVSFVRLGVEHILTGWDHLLFLLVLLLRSGGWLSLVKIVTAFTVAHSVTLALAALDIVALPDRMVEAVIALSIAVVAAENLFLTPVVARRWLVSFAFGLVHGFGFSSVLRELGLPTHGLLVSLLGFNVGVELGQMAVVAVALPALLLVRTTRWRQRVVRGSSAAVLLVGVVLFVERAFG